MHCDFSKFLTQEIVMAKGSKSIFKISGKYNFIELILGDGKQFSSPKLTSRWFKVHSFCIFSHNLKVKQSNPKNCSMKLSARSNESNEI